MLIGSTMLIGSAIVGLVSYLIQVALFVLIAVAFVTALIHPSSDFSVDSRGKKFWLAILGIGVLIGIDRRFVNILFFVPDFLEMLVYWGCVFAAMYFFVSPHAEMSRAGGFTWKKFFSKWGRGGGNTDNSRGSW